MEFEIAVGIVLVGFFAALISAYFATAKEAIPNNVSELFCPFYRVGILWYKLKRKSGPSRRGTGRQKEQILIRQFRALNPAVSGEQQLMEFQILRTAKCMLCIFAGAVLCMAVTVAGDSGNVIQSDGTLQRKEYGQGKTQADLVAVSEDRQEEITFIVEERVYTKEETEALFEQAQEKIEEVMTDGNESLAHVTKRLNLPRSEEGFPFDIVWESSAYDLVDLDGTVFNEELAEPVPVTLTACFRYKNYQFYSTKNVIIYPPAYSPEEMFARSVSKALEKEDELSAEKSSFVLPQKLQSGEKIYWQEKERNDGLLILIFTAAAVVIVFVTHEKEIENKVKERENELLMDYSELIGKLTLYMGAGMTIRNVFLRLNEEYSRKKGQGKQYLYEEIMMTCHELQMGISEIDAYEHFGKRCRLRQYVRLTTLLTQNLKKGSSNLAKLLHQESRDAFEYRKSIARKLGEEAGTKLLGPMIMMLCIVMVIIMIPAYLSFGM